MTVNREHCYTFCIWEAERLSRKLLHSVTEGFIAYFECEYSKLSSYQPVGV